MDDEKRRLRDEVAELSNAVRGLREELASSRGHRGCHGCYCGHAHWWPTWYWAPGQVYCGTTTISTSGQSAGGYIVTNETAAVSTSTIGAAGAVGNTYMVPFTSTCTSTSLM